MSVPSLNAARKVDVMVLAERKTPRDTHVLVRGAWDNKGERVDVDVALDRSLRAGVHDMGIGFMMLGGSESFQ